MFNILATEPGYDVHYVCSVSEGHYFVSATARNVATFQNKGAAEFVADILRDTIAHKTFEIVES